MFLYSVETLWNQKQTNKKISYKNSFLYCEKMVVDMTAEDLPKI